MIMLIGYATFLLLRPRPYSFDVWSYVNVEVKEVAHSWERLNAQPGDSRAGVASKAQRLSLAGAT